MVAGANSIFYGEALLTTPNVTEMKTTRCFPLSRRERTQRGSTDGSVKCLAHSA